MRSKSFLGQGWAFPPTFTRGLNTVATSSEEQNIDENLNILFSTQQGERMMKYDYGTNLRSLAFDSLDGELYNTIEESVRKAIIYFEPRIKVNDVEVSADENVPGVVMVNVAYTIRTTNSRRNFVHPFHLIEGNQIKR